MDHRTRRDQRVAFAKKPEEARAHAERMLAMTVGQFPVETVLVEEKIAIDREFFLSFAIDDAARAQIRSGFGKRLTRNQIPDSMSP